MPSPPKNPRRITRLLRWLWRKRNVLRWPLGVIIFLIVARIVWRLVNEWLPVSAPDSPDYFNQRKDVLQIAAYFIAATVAALGVFFTWRRVAAAEKTVRVSEEGQVTERFTRAVDQLSDENNIVKRLGAIYALERISRNSPDDHWTIMELLTAFVRQYAPYHKAKPPAEDYTIHQDIQAILTVIGRRDEARRRTEPHRLDLHGTNLQRANLTDANLQGAFLSGANLQGTSLHDANLQDARLVGANLQRANLTDANLQRASLNHANLQGAYLIRANLQGAYLHNANLQDASLDVANLQDAFLVDANLQGANLIRANLQDANLIRANLQDARGLTVEHLNLAYLDADTIATLPDYIPKDQVTGKTSAP